jgi:hypothetical protein
MLAICEQYAAECPEKSYLLVFGEQDASGLEFKLNGKEVIPRVTLEKHLGNWFGPGLSDEHFQAVINDMYARTNVLMATFGKCQFDVRYKLFQSFCTAAYGSPLWDFSIRGAKKVYTAWRKCVRRVLGVPPTTHCALLPVLCNDVSLDKQLHKIFLRFFDNGVNSSNDCVSLCANLVLRGSRSATCRSLNYICESYGIRQHNIVRLGRSAYLPSFDAAATLAQVNIVNKSKGGAIRELLQCRDDRALQDVTTAELDFMLNHLCTG